MVEVCLMVELCLGITAYEACHHLCMHSECRRSTLKLNLDGSNRLCFQKSQIEKSLKQTFVLVLPFLKSYMQIDLH
jgi:hypothetical protein